METRAAPAGPLQEPMRCGYIQTPLGQMLAILDSTGALQRLDFVDDERAANSREWGLPLRQDPRAVSNVVAQIGQYFEGRRRVFTLRLAPHGSPFLQRAWQELTNVPFAKTMTYGALARRLRPVSSARAVGRANALNPISIIIPCHRIVAGDGKLSGYSAGLERKAALLDHEGALQQIPLFGAGIRR